MKRCCFAVVLAALLSVGACDHAPLDPLDPDVDITSLLLQDAAGPDATAALAMPGLLQAAVQKVYAEQGSAAARSLVTELQRLHHEALVELSDGDVAESDGVTATGSLERLRAEEIRVVLSVFGEALADRVVDAVRADGVLLARTVAELPPGGPNADRLRVKLANIHALVREGEAFLAQGDAASALAVAARAAHEADGVRRALAEVTRLPTLAVLFEDATARLRTTDPYMADRALEQHQALTRTAQSVIDTGNRDRAHVAAEAVRRDRIQFVLTVLGPAAAERMLAIVAAAQVAAEADVERLAATGHDVFRLERMLRTAHDLHGRAAGAFRDGDPARALDLGSHAADLLGVVRRALPNSAPLTR
jgi:hypothetical protein